MPKRIAIVGAGMSGLVCADRLVQAGFECHVFDKGRRLGGRLATRVQDGLAFNHGAPDLIATGTAFRDLLQRMTAAGGAEKVAEAAGALGTAEATPAFVGWPHMNDLLSPLAARFQVLQSIEIGSLEKHSSDWTLASLDGQVFGPFVAVLVCIPAQQAHNIVQSIKPDWTTDLVGVRYDPYLTMLCALEDELSHLGSIIFDSPNVIAKQFRQSGGLEQPPDISRWVVHATPEWSSDNLEREPADIAQDLFQEFLTVNALPTIHPVFLHGHRWRYARTSEPLGAPCLWDANMGIGLAGDWCLGPDAEHAHESGTGLAEQVIQDMSGR